MQSNPVPHGNPDGAADDAYPNDPANDVAPADPNVKRQPKHAALPDCQCDPLTDGYANIECHTHGIPIQRQPEQPS